VAFQAELSDFGSFYERTYQGAYRTALAILRDHALAADLTQQAYVDAYEHRHRFRGDAPGYAWLHKIVVNTALGAARRKRPVIIRQIEPHDARQSDAAPGTADRLELMTALDALAPKQRAAVVLRYYHDYDYSQIAQMLGTTTSNVGSLLSRALDRLRTELEPHDAARQEMESAR